MATSILDDITKATLLKAKYAQDRTKVDNNHKALAHARLRLEAIANELGIDFNETGFTFTVTKSERYGLSVYGPYVGNSGGQACIIWGNVKKSLAEVQAIFGIEEVDKRCVLEVALDSIHIEETIYLTLMQPKENKADKNTLKKALRKGELGNYLSVSFEKPRSLSELEPGEYQVTEYKATEFSGEVKFSIFIKGKGWFNTNTALRRKLVNSPVINGECPATLEVQESVATTSTGYPIIPVNFITLAEAELEVFSFD